MNINLCEEECDRMETIAARYHLNCMSTFREVASSIEQVVYGMGGKLLHRGFYCPSLIRDIVNGNIHRGKIRRDLKAKSKAIFEFGLDIQGRPVTVQQLDRREFIFHHNNSELSVVFSEAFGVIELSECNFDLAGNLKSYSLFQYNPFQQRVVELEKEIYDYNGNQLDVLWCRFNRYNQVNPIFDCYQYRFAVENDYLTSYQVLPCEQNAPLNYQVFPVRIKRMVKEKSS